MLQISRRHEAKPSEEAEAAFPLPVSCDVTRRPFPPPTFLSPDIVIDVDDDDDDDDGGGGDDEGEEDKDEDDDEGG